MQKRIICPAYKNLTGPSSSPFNRGGRWGIAAVLVFSLFLSGCQMKSAFVKPEALEGTDKGEVFLYTRPFQQEADRLRFHIEGIFAVRDDGEIFPLSMALSDIKSRDMKRQRLIASGRLPAGNYTGFSFKSSRAFLETEEGEAALLAADKPVLIDFPFNIAKEKSYVISLEFNYMKSVGKGIGFSPSFSIFFPDRPIIGLLGYVANADSNNITVFDKKAMQVIGVITTGRGPSGMALDEKQKRVYVALSDDDSVDIIDIKAGDRINSIRLNPGDRPRGPALTLDGGLLITANTGSDSISLIDPAAFIELSRIAVGNGPHSVLIDSPGRRAYVFNTLSSTISVIDLANRSVAATISTEPGPLQGQFNREGSRLYVIHEWSSYVTVIDPFSLSVQGRVRVGMGARAVKLDPRTDFLYIAKKGDTVTEVYDPFSLIPIDYITGEESASYITIDGEGNTLYLVIPGTKNVMIVDMISKKIISEIDVGERPCWVTMMGER
jgi:YVTN family beta-propeller protein